MERMWDAIKKGIQDSAAVAVTKAEEFTQLGRARLDIAAAKTRLSRLHGELGAAAFQRIEAGQGGALAEDPEVGALCGRMREAREALRQAETELEHLQRDLKASAKGRHPRDGDEGSLGS